MKSSKSKIFLVTFFVLATLFFSGAITRVLAENPPLDYPFLPGEKLTYKLRWGLVTAGYAELEVLPFAEINDQEYWHFVLKIKTSSFVDLFYKVRDKVESFVDPELGATILYKKKQREGSTNRDVEVRFNPDENTAVYSNKGKFNDPIRIETETIDPLSSIYYIRTQKLDKNMEIVRSVTDGKKSVQGRARVIRRENVYTGGTKYDTYLVEPDLKDVRGVFEKSKKSRMKLWFTADQRRLLVKIKSKVVVGSFTGSLVKVINPKLMVAEPK